MLEPSLRLWNRGRITETSVVLLLMIMMIVVRTILTTMWITASARWRLVNISKTKPESGGFKVSKGLLCRAPTLYYLLFYLLFQLLFFLFSFCLLYYLILRAHCCLRATISKNGFLIIIWAIVPNFQLCYLECDVMVSFKTFFAFSGIRQIFRYKIFFSE